MIRRLRYLKILISKNPWKIAMLIAIFFLSFILSNIKSTYIQKDRIVKKIEIEGSKFIVVENYKKDYVIRKFSNVPEKDGYQVYESRNESFYFLLVLIGGLVIITVVGTCTSDNDCNWEFYTVNGLSYYGEVVCEYVEEEEDEHSKYYYIINDRILFKSSSAEPRSYSNIENILSRYIENPKLFLKFKTKQKVRDEKISKILT